MEIRNIFYNDKNKYIKDFVSPKGQFYSQFKKNYRDTKNIIINNYNKRKTDGFLKEKYITIENTQHIPAGNIKLFCECFKYCPMIEFKNVSTINVLFLPILNEPDTDTSFRIYPINIFSDKIDVMRDYLIKTLNKPNLNMYLKAFCGTMASCYMYKIHLSTGHSFVAVIV